MNWYITVWRKTFNFQGRSRRKEFWMFLLIHIGIAVILALFAAVFNNFNLNSEFGSIPLALYLFASVIPFFAVMSRRLHDQGTNRLFVLLIFVPYIGGLILIILMALPGTPGQNKYGPDQKQNIFEIDEIGK